ncbi:MAG: hypothetical protein LBM13_01080 [Candidatus Ancillula sp.]|jgi:hypothetical protein|nr:hypothetical protein [Candidatus Ancillula sp.]
MFLRKIKNREGNIYLSAVENYRQDGKRKQRVVISYGRLDKLLEKEPGAIERIKSEIEILNIENKQKRAQSLVRSISSSGWSTIKSEEELKKKAKILNFNIVKTSTLPKGQKPRRKLVVECDFDEKRDSFSIKYIGSMLFESIYEDIGINEIVLNYCRKNGIKENLLGTLKSAICDLIFLPEDWNVDEDTPQRYFQNWQITINDWLQFLTVFYDIAKEIRVAVEKYTRPLALSRMKVSPIVYAISYRTLDTGLSEMNIVDDATKLKEYAKLRKGATYTASPSLVKLGVLGTLDGLTLGSLIDTDRSTSNQIYTQKLFDQLKESSIKKILILGTQYLYTDSNLTKIKNYNHHYIMIKGLVDKPRDFEGFFEEAVSSDGWEYSVDRELARKSFIRTKTLKNGTKYQEKVLLVWDQAIANQVTNQNYGIEMFTEGMIHTNKYAFSYDRRRIKPRNSTTEEFNVELSFHEELVKNLQTGKEEKLNPYLEYPRPINPKTGKHEKSIVPGISIIVTDNIDYSDDFIIFNIGKYNNFKKQMGKRKQNEVYSRSTIAWTKEQVQSSMACRFLGLFLASVIKLVYGIGLGNHSNFYSYLLANEYVEPIGEVDGEEVYECRNGSHFIYVMKKLGIDWTYRFVTKKQIEELAHIPWMKMLKEKYEN